MTSFLGNENVQKALRSIDRRLRAIEISDLQKVLGTPEGRRVYCRIVYEMCNLEGLVFNGNIKDGGSSAQIMANLDGQRTVGRLLLEEAVQHTPELWKLARNERDAKLASDATHRELTVEKSAKEHPNE